MTWYAVYETATGRLKSLGTVLANPMPVEFTVQVLAAEPASDQMWDEATRTFVPRPAKIILDLVDKIMADADLSTLNATARTRIRTVLERHIPLADRYYV